MRNFFLALQVLLAYPAAAQLTDSLRVRVGVATSMSTTNNQPLWITANRYGTIAQQQFDASAYLLVRNKHLITPRRPVEDSPAGGRQPGFYVEYGGALYNNNHLRSTFLEQAYAQVGYRTLRLLAGRYREVTGEIDQTLSSGSLGISGNARPAPKIELAVAEYTAVPFTQGWVQFKGQFAHGWLGSSADIQGVLLHQKAFYLRIGKQRLRFYGGLTHFAQWGGSFPSGPAPSRFRDYLRILAGASGNAADPVYQQGPVDIANAVGNHLLIPEFGLTWRGTTATLRAYTQTIFDKGVGDSANTNRRDKLAGLKILGRDRLVGLSWESSQPTLLQKILVEGLYTKHQGGPIIYQGRDNYYNNGTYAMGWQYQNRIIGTPLFINRAAAERYGARLDRNVLNSPGIVSNRVVGLHLGIRGQLAPGLGYRLLATHVRHYGNYYNDAAFQPAKAQSHVLLEVPYYFKHFTITVAAAADYGDLSKTTAGLLRGEWRLR